MAEKAICPTCNKRRAERFCPALGEKICTVDCATGREVTIDCPSDCPFLIAAHRWEEAHPKPLAPADLPFPDVAFPAGIVHLQRATLTGLGYTVLLAAREDRTLNDADIFAAVEAMAATSRTLASGLYYEKPPAAGSAATLYAAIAKFLDEERKRIAEAGGALKETDIFHVLVFFLRFGHVRSNGRPKTRAFLEFLRSQFPREAGLTPEAPRIVLS